MEAGDGPLMSLLLRRPGGGSPLGSVAQWAPASVFGKESGRWLVHAAVSLLVSFRVCVYVWLSICW